MSALITPGNVDDRQPVPQLVRKLFGDKGYLSKKLADALLEQLNLQLITKLQGNMKNRLLLLSDALFLRKRAIVESIDQLKNISQIEHSRHRSPFNCVVYVLCGLIAYGRREKKPSLGLGQLACLPA